MRDKKSLDSILENFNPSDSTHRIRLSDGKPLTIWLCQGDKDRYDRLQQTSGRRFCVKLRELILAAMEVAEQSNAS